MRTRVRARPSPLSSMRPPKQGDGSLKFLMGAMPSQCPSPSTHVAAWGMPGRPGMMFKYFGRGLQPPRPSMHMPYKNNAGPAPRAPAAAAITLRPVATPWTWDKGGGLMRVMEIMIQVTCAHWAQGCTWSDSCLSGIYCQTPLCHLVKQLRSRGLLD